MATSNSNAYIPSALDGSWSIDILKSLVENPCQISNISRTFATFHNDASPEHEFMVKYLQDLYNPPETNFQLSKQRLKELQLMGTKDRHPPGFFLKNGIKKVDMVWKSDPEPPPMIQVMNRPTMRNNFFPFSNLAYPARPIDKVVNQKRELNINHFYDSTGKKIRGQRAIAIRNPTKNNNIIDLDADDTEVISLARKPKKVNRSVQYRHITRTGLKLNRQTSKTPIEIIDSPRSEDLNENETLSNKKPQEEEKDGDRETTTNATNMTNRDEPNDIGASKEGTMNFYNFDSEDFGIKILGEVFLCGKCQKQISQKDVDKGYKEICSSCSKVKDKVPKSAGNKKNQIVAVVGVINEEPLKFEQESSLNFYESKQLLDNRDKYDILAPIYRSRGYYEESALINILDSTQNNKHIPTGKDHQVAISPLTLYTKDFKRKIKKLWKPGRIDLASYEKFRNDVNGKNSLYLLDEEITEILVRHKYNIEQALAWSLKSNPEFQYYVKRSSNRRRIITRGVGRNYYAEQ